MTHEIKFNCLGDDGVMYKNVDILYDGAVRGGCMPVGLENAGCYNGKLLQYIGRKDNHGVEIYEDDILDIHSAINGCRIFIVRRIPFGWTIEYGVNAAPPLLYEYSLNLLFDYSEAAIEKIGNIHEHPQLVATAKKKTK